MAFEDMKTGAHDFDAHSLHNEADFFDNYDKDDCQDFKKPEKDCGCHDKKPEKNCGCCTECETPVECCECDVKFKYKYKCECKWVRVCKRKYFEPPMKRTKCTKFCEPCCCCKCCPCTCGRCQD